MSFLFGNDAPTPVAVPIAPSNDAEAARKREAAAQAAAAESRAGGRRSTIVGGMAIAEDEQRERGMLRSAERNASRTLG
jgi:hypothetical protein